VPSVADDVVAITAVLSRYSMAMDLRRWELMDEVFTPDGEIFFNGRALHPSARGVALIRACVECCSYTHHDNTTVMVDLDGDRADVVTNVRAWHRGGPNDDKVMEAIGRYIDEFVRTPSGWRISSRHEEIEVMLGDLDIFDGAAEMMASVFGDAGAETPLAE
jgi:SnoaL-like domain